MKVYSVLATALWSEMFKISTTYEGQLFAPIRKDGIFFEENADDLMNQISSSDAVKIPYYISTTSFEE